MKKFRSCCCYLALPVGRVDEDDAVRELVVGHQDVVELVIHRLSWDLWREISDEFVNIRNHISES